ncbi:hypothetical protein F5Y09DRAFT_353159 [Xylaria sp. FL1042]|nr:hypothetical protein F5Y09DRAFT_353159 [Xylaria sp. FL1042]
MPSKMFKLLSTCFCFPMEESRPSSPVRDGRYYNAKVRANLGLELPVRNANPSPYNTTSPPGRQSPPRPRIMTEGPVSGSNYSNVSWATSNMNREELKELFNLVHETLAHVPYAICGLAALIDHGFTGRKTSRISIICRQESRKNVKIWAKARGYEVYTDSIGIPLRNGSIRRVRIKYIEFGFETLQRVRSSFSNATVLSLTSQLDNVAAGYLDHQRRGSDEKTLTVIAADIFFCLSKMARRREKVDPHFLPTFLGEDFFNLFTKRYVETRPEMARAGIDVSKVLAKHRAAWALREHDEMLRKYGMRGDTAQPQPGHFENMKNLKHKKSVYTIQNQSVQDYDEVPPMPRLPDPSYAPARTAAGARSGAGRARKPPPMPKPTYRPPTDWV